MNGTVLLKEPIGCTEEERREFARLVRRAFDGSDEGLDGRIRSAESLAFYYAEDETLVAIAGLKKPDERYRKAIFAKAEARVRASDYGLELGWVFVVPAYRGRRIAEQLCRTLLGRVPTSHVFATTRPDNVQMISILVGLDFARVGRPFPRRNEELVLFLK